MVTLISTQETLKQKLQAQENPTVVFADIDGTLFSPNHLIVTAPFYNRKIAHYLHARNIPFIAITGRSDLTPVDKLHLSLLGFEPDCVVSANGTVIYQRLTNKTYARDMEWEAIMQYSKVKYEDGSLRSWNKLDISNAIKEYLVHKNISATFGTGNTFLIRIKFISIPLSQLQQIRKDILGLFPSGLRIIYTEKLLRKNTMNIFSGEMLITPKFGGKDNAVKYLLTKYAKLMGKVTDALIFGDATVDIPMLTMKDNLKYYALFQYLVHPTPLARKLAQEAQKSNTHLHILSGNGPQEIFKIVEALSKSSKQHGLKGFDDVILNTREGSHSIDNHSKLYSEPQTFVNASETRRFGEPSPESGKQSQQPNSQTMRPSSLSPAQNNPIRKLVRLAEPLLDRLTDKNLSPNDVSFLGLTKLSQGLNQIYSKQPSLIQKTKGLFNYGFGNLTDVLDGIRARHSDKKEDNGQLVDGFSDRTKEFMQLFVRAKKRLEESQRKALLTFLAAISCALPSIARAQVEISGKAVSERDEKGGSMIDRTKKLFLSLFMDILNAQIKSEAIDQKIYSSNIATFENRLNSLSSSLRGTKQSLSFIDFHNSQSFSDFQKEALERWLLYIDVLQQEDAMIKKYISKNPKLLKEYERESKKLAKDYLSLKIPYLRKKWHIQDYKLQIKDYIH